MAISPGDIVQVDPFFKPETFGGCLLIATEVDARWVLGYVTELQMQINGVVYVRVPIDSVKPTGGKAQWAHDAVLLKPES